MRGLSCSDCRGTEYKGRRAVEEILVLTDEIQEMIVNEAPIRHIKQAAKENGTRTLREAALELVKQGQTTLEEIKRVTLHA
jgi:general secretion pathway protein E